MLNIAKINLVTLRKNALAIKSKLNAGVKFCAVVKADAYGHGAPAVSNHIYDIVDCFAVALVEEGVELRNSGIDKEILVLTPIVKADLERAVAFNLTLTVESKAQILQIDKESKRQNKKTFVHVKYNTGMNRFGVDSLQELSELLAFCQQKKWVKVSGMYSHLGCPQNKKLLKLAVNKFLLANNLVKGYNKNAVCHLSASGGFLMGAQFDMVRIGILLYGYKPFSSSYVSVAPVMKVYAPIIRTRPLKKGQNLLYGDFELEKDASVSLVRFGYADGLERKKISGQFNNRCMDITATINKGCAKLLPIMIDANSLAKVYHTIAYEILTKVSARAERKYIR